MKHWTQASNMHSAGQPHPGLHKSSVANRSRELILPLCSVFMRSHLDGLHPALGIPTQESRGPLGASPSRARKMVRGLEPLSCEDRLGVEAALPGEWKGLGRNYISPLIHKEGLQEGWRERFYKGKR